MNREIDLEKAGEAEAFGALAIGPSRKHVGGYDKSSGLSEGQVEVLADMVNFLLRLAHQTGADRKVFSAGSISLELREEETEEVLSIRKAVV
jgi:hypothetical protein